MKFLLGIILSLNAMALTLESNNQIKASDLNEHLNFLFKIFHKSGIEGATYTGASIQQVSGRTLNFTKKYDATKLVLTYSDVFRVYNNEKMCTLYLEVNGQPCTEGPLFKSIYAYSSHDINSLKISHTCSGVPKGAHTYSIKVKAASFGNAYLGGYCEFSWSNNSSFLMTVKEVF